MNIKEFRTKYPEYNDIPDIDLAKKLHAKDYSDIPFEDFATRFGVQKEIKPFGGASAGMTFPFAGTVGKVTDSRERGLLGETGAALARGALNVGKGLVGTAEAFLTKAQRGLYPEPEAFEAAQKVGPARMRTAVEKIESAEQKFQRTIQGPGGWALNVVGEAVPYMGATLAGGYAAGPVGAAVVGFSVEGQNAADEYLKKHPGDFEGANTDRVVVGSLNATIEALQIGRLMKFQKTGKHSLIAFKDLVKKKAYGQLAKAGGQFSKEVLKTSVENAAEEFLQEGVSLAVPTVLRGDYPKKPDGSPDVWAIGERLGAAALGGGVAGGILGAGGTVTLASPELAAPSMQRIETLAEKIQTDPKLGEIEKAMLIRDLVKDILPADHPAKRQTQFGPDVVQVWRGKESGKIYPETKTGGETRMEEVAVAKAGPGAEGKAQIQRPEWGPDRLAFVAETGQSGLSIEPLDYTDDVSKNLRAVVFRDDQGKAVGTIKFELKDDGTLENRVFEDTKEGRNQIEVFVDPKYRRQGIATKMWNFAKEHGYDFSKVPAQLYTEEGEAFTKSLTQSVSAAEQQTRIISTETGEELELDKDLTAKATAEARPPTIFDISEATQKTLDAAKKVGDILIELEPQRGEFKEKMEAKKYGIWNRAEDLVKKYAPEFGDIVARKRAMAFAQQQLRESVPGLTDRLSADEHAALQRAINESTWYNPGEKMNLSTTLHELFDLGIQPDKSSIRLFDKFFGTNVLAQVQRTAPKKWWKKIGWYAKEGLLEMTGGMKQLVTSFDFSAGGVQAPANLFRHPIKWFAGTGVGYRSALSNRYARFLEVEMKTSPNYKRIVEDGQLAITKVGSVEAGEEMFRRGSWVQKIPVWGKVVAGSERAYVANLNYQRFGVAEKMLAAQEGEEVSVAKDRELMDHIGNLTGRGKGKPGGWFEKFMELWSAISWSPRLYKAVVNLPIDFIRLPHIRKIAAHDAVQAFVLMGLTTWLASLIPGVERDDDPRSSDFWKLKYGNTRYNPLGRYQQLIRLIAQMSTGQVKSSTSGRVYEKEWTDTLTHYLRGKLGPGPGVAVDIATGKTFKGEPLNEESLLKYIGEHVTPLFAQDLADAIRFQGLDSSTPFTVVLGSHGISTQTYEVTPTQETMQYKDQLAHEYFGANWDQLGEEAQKALREARPSIAEYERKAKFEQEDVTFRGLIAQEALNAGNKVTRKLPGKVQKELERLQVRVGELKRYSGNNWYLNQERYKQFQDTLADALTKALPKITESKEWIGMNPQPDAQREALESVLKDAKKYAWDKVKAQVNAEDFIRREDVINERETTVAGK